MPRYILPMISQDQLNFLPYILLHITYIINFIALNFLLPHKSVRKILLQFFFTLCSIGKDVSSTYMYFCVNS